MVKSQVIAANKKESAKYWEDVEPTVDGMLSGKNGGLGYLSDADIENSEEFLKTLSKVNKVMCRHISRFIINKMSSAFKWPATQSL